MVSVPAKKKCAFTEWHLPLSTTSITGRIEFSVSYFLQFLTRSLPENDSKRINLTIFRAHYRLPFTDPMTLGPKCCEQNPESSIYSRTAAAEWKYGLTVFWIFSTLEHQGPRRQDIPAKNFMQGAFSSCCFQQGVAGMSRDLGREGPGSEKLYARRFWVDFSFPIYFPMFSAELRAPGRYLQDCPEPRARKRLTDPEPLKYQKNCLATTFCLTVLFFPHQTSLVVVFPTKQRLKLVW